MEYSQHSQFTEMFGNPISGWKYPIVKLSDSFEIGTGGTPSRDDADNYGGKVPWVKSTEVSYNYISSTEECLSEKGLKVSNCKIYDANTVLIAMYGQGSTRGRVAILSTPASVNQAIAAIQVQDADLAIFVYYLLYISYDKIRNMAIGGNQKNLNLKLVGLIPYIKVPRDLQTQFAEIVRQADKSKFDENNKIKNICHISMNPIPLRKCL